MANSGYEENDAIMCGNHRFPIALRTPYSYSYPISSNEGTSHGILPHQQNCLLGSTWFTQDLSSWMSNNNVFDRSLYFVHMRIENPRSTSINLQLHDQVRPRRVDLNAYDQVAHLSEEGSKLIRAMFKALKIKHRMGEFHRGDLSCPRSYGIRFVNNEIDEVYLIPGIYTNQQFLDERLVYTNDLLHQQKQDVFQLDALLKDHLIKLPENVSGFFTNYNSQVVAPRLPKCIGHLFRSLAEYQSLTRCFFEGAARSKGNFYDHFAVSDCRMRDITNVRVTGTVTNRQATFDWEYLIVKGSKLELFKNDVGNTGKPISYHRTREDLIRFIKSASTHMRHKVYAHEFIDNKYLEFVMSEIFHNHYKAVFEVVGMA